MKETEETTSGTGWQLFQLDEIKTAHEAAGNSYYQFIDNTTMSMGLYILKAGTIDPQSPHNEDEVYYVISGNAKLRIEQTDYAAVPGAILFVGANVSHQFHTITADLETLVLFSKSIPNPSDLSAQSNLLSSILTGKNQSQNIWDPFLNRSTMTLGMYMLPKNLNGDSPLTHQTDEINIMINGTGQFKIRDQIINIKPGSIFFVQNGFAHNFQALESDNDILIFWNKPDQSQD